jgi:hypothetical protein
MPFDTECHLWAFPITMEIQAPGFAAACSRGP